MSKRIIYLKEIYDRKRKQLNELGKFVHEADDVHKNLADVIFDINGTSSAGTKTRVRVNRRLQ